MLTKEKIKEILSKRIEEINSLQIPHFSLLSDIDKASKRVKKAIENNEKIVIVGDYDVDGVSSSAIMYEKGGRRKRRKGNKKRRKEKVKEERKKGKKKKEEEDDREEK